MYIVRYDWSGFPWSGVALANFTSSAPGERCYTRVADGDCMVVDCRASAVDGGSISPHYRSAGTVTVSGGTGADITLNPDADGYYATQQQNSERFQPGDVLKWSAAGDVIPAFEFDVTFPTPIDMTDPDLENIAHGTWLLDRSVPLVLKWEPTDGLVGFHLGQYLKSGQVDDVDYLSMDCVYPAQPGTATIPIATLLELQASGGGGYGTELYAWHVVVKDLSAGAYPVRALVVNGVDRQIEVE